MFNWTKNTEKSKSTKTSINKTANKTIKRPTKKCVPVIWTEEMEDKLFWSWLCYSTEWKWEIEVFSYYPKIAADLREAGFKNVSSLYVKAKINWLSRIYREEKSKTKVDGAPPSDWKYYKIVNHIIKNHVGSHDIHKFFPKDDETSSSDSEDENQAVDENNQVKGYMRLVQKKKIRIEDPPSSQTNQSREFVWTEPMEKKLLSMWKIFSFALRLSEDKKPVYLQMENYWKRDFDGNGFPNVPAHEIKRKIHSFAKIYRKEARRMHMLPLAPTKWMYFSKVHKLIGDVVDIWGPDTEDESSDFESSCNDDGNTSKRPLNDGENVKAKKIRLENPMAMCSTTKNVNLVALQEENLLKQKKLLDEQIKTTKIQKETAMLQKEITQMDLLIKKSQMDNEKERLNRLANTNLNISQTRTVLSQVQNIKRSMSL